MSGNQRIGGGARDGVGNFHDEAVEVREGRRQKMAGAVRLVVGGGNVVLGTGCLTTQKRCRTV